MLEEGLYESAFYSILRRPYSLSNQSDPIASSVVEAEEAVSSSDIPRSKSSLLDEIGNENRSRNYTILPIVY
jgi:hypothetical protein